MYFQTISSKKKREEKGTPNNHTHFSSSSFSSPQSHPHTRPRANLEHDGKSHGELTWRKKVLLPYTHLKKTLQVNNKHSPDNDDPGRDGCHGDHTSNHETSRRQVLSCGGRLGHLYANKDEKVGGAPRLALSHCDRSTTSYLMGMDPPCAGHHPSLPGRTVAHGHDTGLVQSLGRDGTTLEKTGKTKQREDCV